MSDQPDDEVVFIRKIVTQAIRDISFHEKELAKCHHTIATVSAIMQRVFDEMDFRAIKGDNEDNPRYRDNAAAYIKGCMEHALSAMKFHEEELHTAHMNIGFVKIMLARGKYDIDINEVTAEYLNTLKAGQSSDHRKMNTTTAAK